jgi:V8-like Glu-specific endopeptidase
MISSKKKQVLIFFFLFISILFNSVSAEIRVPQIVGGYEAVPGKWPWVTALASTGASPYDGQFCGGALIDKDWVITAAHCLTTETVESMDIIIGIHDLINDTNYKRLAIDKIYVSPAYETGLDDTVDGDIALIKLKTSVLDYQPIALNQDPSLSAPGVVSTIIGWGKLSTEGSAAEKLQEVQIPIVSIETVNASGIYSWPLKADALAAGKAEGGQDSCQGDSGGPLMVPDSAGTGWELAGLVSFGPEGGCAIPNGYGVYSSVPYYYTAINKIKDLDYIDATYFRIKSALESDDNKNQSGSYVEEFIYQAPSTSINLPLQIYVQEGNFLPVLEISNYETGKIISSSSSDSDELTTSFNPEPGKKYRFRVSAKNSGKTGTYDFNGPTIELAKRAQRVLYDSEIQGELTSGDLSQDAAENLYYDDYIIKDLEKDTPINITVNPDSSANDFYPNIVVTKANDGSLVASVYDKKIPAQVDFTAQKGEQYNISIQAVANSAPGKYTLKITGLGKNDSSGSSDSSTSSSSSGSSCFISSLDKSQSIYSLLFLSLLTLALFLSKKRFYKN